MSAIEKETSVSMHDLKGQSPTSTQERPSTPEAIASNTIQEQPKRKWTSYVWDTLDKPAAERRFLFKLDSALLTFATLGYFIKYLDQNNINNAFVSGMKEDLGLYGNQLNYMQTLWTVGYVIGQIPCTSLVLLCSPTHVTQPT
jgi:ACS family pantothenate transporter-like MFS transporter